MDNSNMRIAAFWFIFSCAMLGALYSGNNHGHPVAGALLGFALSTALISLGYMLLSYLDGKGRDKT